jgi:hypothetical protein
LCSLLTRYYLFFELTMISNRSTNYSVSNGYQSNNSNDNNEEDQLNRINLQALQNRDPYISKIVDQAQRVCVYKFIAEKREWVKFKFLKKNFSFLFDYF